MFRIGLEIFGGVSLALFIAALINGYIIGCVELVRDGNPLILFVYIAVVLLGFSIIIIEQ